MFEIACPACEIFVFSVCQYRPCWPAEVSRGGNEAEERELVQGTSSGGVKGGKVIRLLAPNPARSPYFGAASKLWVKLSRAASVERKFSYLVCRGRYESVNIGRLRRSRVICRFRSHRSIGQSAVDALVRWSQQLVTVLDVLGTWETYNRSRRRGHCQ